MLKDFRKFIMRGNLLDLAIGFTVGAAFTTVARSLVSDIVMPPIGLVIGGADFADQFRVLKPGIEALPPYATLADAQAAGAVTLNYGVFINNVIALLLVAWVIYHIVRAVNRIQDRLAEDDQAPDEAAPTEKKCRYCKEVVELEATRCPHCTSHLSSPEEVAQAPQGPSHA